MWQRLPKLLDAAFLTWPARHQVGRHAPREEGGGVGVHAARLEPAISRSARPCVSLPAQEIDGYASRCRFCYVNDIVLAILELLKVSPDSSCLCCLCCLPPAARCLPLLLPILLPAAAARRPPS